jgi:hypothetical protein
MEDYNISTDDIKLLGVKDIRHFWVPICEGDEGSSRVEITAV